MRLNNQELVNLLEMANAMRKANGDKLLDDLPLSIPRDETACLIANAFNYGCIVIPEDEHSGGGNITFNSLNDAQNYCEITGLNLDHYYLYPENYCEFNLPLTVELNAIAMAFDRNEYEEYEDLPYD